MSAPTPPALCVDVRRAAEMLSVSEWTVRAWLANGVLPVVKLPGVQPGTVSRRVLIRVSDLERFRDNHVERAS